MLCALLIGKIRPFSILHKFVMIGVEQRAFREIIVAHIIRLIVFNSIHSALAVA